MLDAGFHRPTGALLGSVNSTPFGARKYLCPSCSNGWRCSSAEDASRWTSPLSVPRPESSPVLPLCPPSSSASGPSLAACSSSVNCMSSSSGAPCPSTAAGRGGTRRDSLKSLNRGSPATVCSSMCAKSRCATQLRGCEVSSASRKPSSTKPSSSASGRSSSTAFASEAIVLSSSLRLSASSGLSLPDARRAEAHRSARAQRSTSRVSVRKLSSVASPWQQIQPPSPGAKRSQPSKFCVWEKMCSPAPTVVRVFASLSGDSMTGTPSSETTSRQHMPCG
mmetsp:Transcript_57384/g.168011  ORF Transcript_57384/g.168011 Transcript_57384/m.168011 type:complete len:279 (+) Transcript_57384:202-1038(+)